MLLFPFPFPSFLGSFLFVKSEIGDCGARSDEVDVVQRG